MYVHMSNNNPRPYVALFMDNGEMAKKLRLKKKTMFMTRHSH